MNSELHVLQKFKDSFAAGRLGHAYLIVGSPRGGAARLAEKILQMLFCEAPRSNSPQAKQVFAEPSEALAKEGESAQRPCGTCANCQRVARRLHPDIIWIEPIKKSRGILVEQIEEVLRQTFQTTFEGGWKAIVLVSAERMNNEAANKLLKTLEEPPRRSIFLLLSDQPEALLPTIISRCQRVALPDCPDEPEDTLRREVVDIAAAMGQGGVAARLLKARAFVELLKKTREQAENELADALTQNQISGEEREDIEEIGQGRVEAEYRERRRQILRFLLLWQRDLLFAVNGFDDDLLFFGPAAGKIREAAGRLTGLEIMHNINIVEKMQACLDQHLPEAFVIERAFLQFAAGKGK